MLLPRHNSKRNVTKASNVRIATATITPASRNIVSVHCLYISSGDFKPGTSASWFAGIPGTKIVFFPADV